MSETRSPRRRFALRRQALLNRMNRARLARVEMSRAEQKRPRVPEPAQRRDPVGEVPYPLQVAAALCWRLLVVIGALVVLGLLLIELSVVVIPVAVALLLTALLGPAVDTLTQRGVPRGAATTVVLIGGLAAVGGVLTFVVRAFIAGLPDLQTQVTESFNTIEGWLVNGPLRMSQSELASAVDSLSRTLSENREQITSGAVSVAGGVGHFVTGVLLMLFTLIFFLHDGRSIWSFLLWIVPAPTRDRVDVAGQRGFAALVGYVRAGVIVAVVDAVGIGIGLWAVGVPLVVPLAALVFLGAFVPIIGAVLAGVVAVLVALVANGFVPALIVLAIVIGVQQLEGHVLQPLLMGRAVKIHPLVVVLAVAGGVVVAGIVGALLAVPLVAVANAMVRSLLSGDPATPEQVDATDPMDAAAPGEVAEAERADVEPADSAVAAEPEVPDPDQPPPESRGK